VTSLIESAAAAGSRYERLIKHDKVHGSLYTDPGIFAEELRKIWYRTWVFVGHESEVSQPGDYMRKRLGLQDVIMTRDRDGQLHLLLNRCAHRGNQVCADAKGNSSTFRCPYHGWTYRNTGELVGFPFFKGYGGRELDLSLGRPPARSTGWPGCHPKVESSSPPAGCSIRRGRTGNYWRRMKPTGITRNSCTAQYLVSRAVRSVPCTAIPRPR